MDVTWSYITESLQNAKSLEIFKDFVVQGQGLEVQVQRQGLVNGLSRTLEDKDFRRGLYNTDYYHANDASQLPASTLLRSLLVASRAGSVSVFGVGISIRYFRRYFFHVGSVSVFLKYWLKIANFWYSTSIWRPYWGWPRRNCTVGYSGRLLEN